MTRAAPSGAVFVGGGVLFDVDGTLLLGSVSHLLVLGETLSRHLGHHVPMHIDGERPMLGERNLAGYVDVQVAREALAAARGAPPEEAEVAAVMAQYERDYASVELPATAKVIRGVPEALERLSSADIRLGLVTGNASFVARAKLERLGLDRYFRFERDLGFGDWRADRSAVAAAAVAGLLHEALRLEDVAYVGDTPRDMQAARAAGIRAIGVLSGAGTEEALRVAGADIVTGSVADLYPDETE